MSLSPPARRCWRQGRHAASDAEIANARVPDEIKPLLMDAK
eukprot:COSAG06_NODE_70424_length_192_cov_22.462366_1_plen_40_part_10